jgi:hypothetical protein
VTWAWAAHAACGGAVQACVQHWPREPLSVVCAFSSVDHVLVLSLLLCCCEVPAERMTRLKYPTLELMSTD